MPNETRTVRLEPDSASDEEWADPFDKAGDLGGIYEGKAGEYCDHAAEPLHRRHYSRLKNNLKKLEARPCAIS